MPLLYDKALPSLLMLSVLSGLLHADSDRKQIASSPSERWLAGDHHIHSRYSVGWDRETNPPHPHLRR